MPTILEDYYGYVKEQAEDFVNEYFEDFLGEILDGDTDVYQMLDYRGQLHEHVDQYLDLKESAEIIESSSNVETDSGLWEGLEPVKAIEVQAFYTMKYDIEREVLEIIKDRLLDEEVKLQGKITEAEVTLDELKEKLEGLSEDADNNEEEIETLEELIEEKEEEIDELSDKIRYVQESYEGI